jgi:hypothetical protein
LAAVQILFIYTYKRISLNPKNPRHLPPQPVWYISSAVPVGASQAAPVYKNQIKMLRHYMTRFSFFFLSAHLSPSDGFSIHFTFDVGERRRRKKENV